MTDNKEKREFEEIMDKIFGTEPSRYSAWNKELFLQMFNEAYAKGRQSVLDNFPSALDMWSLAMQCKNAAIQEPMGDVKLFRLKLLSKLSGDKGG